MYVCVHFLYSLSVSEIKKLKKKCKELKEDKFAADLKCLVEDAKRAGAEEERKRAANVEQERINQRKRDITISGDHARLARVAIEM